MPHIAELNGFELSIMEIGEMTGWPQSMVEDYRSLNDGILSLIDSILAVAANIDPPATATSTGTAGSVAYDNDFAYFCIATDTWKRAPLTTW